jgi:hypothetical protein
MSVFGNQNIGASWLNISGSYGVLGGKATLAEAGIITSITAYFGQDSGSGSYSFALYTVTGGGDGALVGYTAPAAIISAYDWRTQNLVTPYVAVAGDFYLEIWTNGTAVYTKYDASGVFSIMSVPGTFPTWPNPLLGSEFTGLVSIYATYTTGGASITPTPNALAGTFALAVPSISVTTNLASGAYVSTIVKMNY